jgi:F-type H+-transporting ATPase subunit b
MTIPISVVASSGSIVDFDATLLVQAFIFLLMFFLLRSLLFRPVIRLIEKRRKITEGSKNEAEALEQEAASLNEDVEGQLLEVRSSVSKEREKMVEESKRQASEILRKAREDSGIVVSQAKEETAAKAEQVRQILRAEIGSLVDIVAAKVLGRSI